MLCSTRRALLLGLVCWVTAIAARAATADEAFADATTALLGARSEKVRVQAALVLGRAGDRRATPYLIRALSDANVAVRATAAEALGKLADSNARAALEHASHDPGPSVRRHALLAMAALDAHVAEPAAAGPAPVAADAGHDATTIEVKPIGDSTGHAPAGLRDEMRTLLGDTLKTFGNHTSMRYKIDGAIKALTFSAHANTVEVKCVVQLILSTARGNSIVMMSSGEATVQKQRRHYRPAMEPAMAREAMQHAARSASDELRQHFAANGP